MAENRAGKRGSRTAEVVAAVRARHLLRHRPPWVLEDRYAIRFAGPRWRRILSSDALDWLFSRVILRRLMPVGMQQLVRARFAEDRIAVAAARGVSQLVILGAGFDSFALRRPDLSLAVFEADLAATLAIKRERMTAAGIRAPAGLRFVSVDFEKDDLGGRLAASGFDRRRATFFNWMGVSYYLLRDAVRETLAQVTDLAAPGSELTLDYLLAEEGLAPADRALLAGVKRFVARRGEPLRTTFHPKAVERDLGLDAHWELRQHDSPADQATRYLEGRTDLPPLPPLFGCLHLRRR